jgi:hypothetical protein
MAEAAKKAIPTWEGEGFDTRVSIKDKTGKTVRHQPYRLHSTPTGQAFERDGRFYWPNGDEMAEDKAAEFRRRVGSDKPKAKVG